MTEQISLLNNNKWELKMAGKCLRTGGSNKLHSWTKRSGKLSVRNNANHNKSIALFPLTNQQRRGGGEGGGEIGWHSLNEKITLKAGVPKKTLTA